MAVQAKGTNWVIEYTGAYGGLNVAGPSLLIPDNDSPLFNNFLLRNAELRSRPNLNPIFPGAAQWQLGITSFIDINGTYHTVEWSGQNLYQYNPALLPGNPWALVGQCAPGDMQTNPVSYRTFASTLYYTDIGVIVYHISRAGGGGSFSVTIFPYLGYWDGLALAPVFTQTFADASTSHSVAGISRTNSPAVSGSLPNTPAMVGPMAIGGAFLGELNNQLILANLTIADEGSGNLIYNYPTGMWWSANGLPQQWDPTVNTSAGFNFFLDVPDVITGLMTLGVAGYIFRTNGITQFAPTGSVQVPWQFDHMWASDHGIGNILPWSIAQYGPQGAFVATDNIYALSITNASPIGGKARDLIMYDLARTSGGAPFANIIPRFVAGYVYLDYMLLVPLATGVRAYIYAFEEKNWSAWDLNIIAEPGFPILTCAPNFV